jgi:hypothetical protein
MASVSGSTIEVDNRSVDLTRSASVSLAQENALLRTRLARVEEAGRKDKVT